MEQTTKRVKTHGFENDAEAKAYVDSLLLGKPELPKEIWVKILSSNPQLSTFDIQRMCRVNTVFREMCDSGIIWDQIYIRQFGAEAFRMARDQMPGDSLSRLFAARFIKIVSPGPTDGRAGAWTLSSSDPRSMVFSFNISGIDYTMTRTYSFQFSSRLFMGYHFEFIHQFTRDLIDQTAIDYYPIISSDLGEISVVWNSFGRNPPHIYNSNFEHWIIHYLFKHKYYQKGGGKYYYHHMYTGQCATCGEDANYRCGKCKQQLYCGDECAQKDWKLQHQKICK